jgi:hypothetical protein
MWIFTLITLSCGFIAQVMSHDIVSLFCIIVTISFLFYSIMVKIFFIISSSLWYACYLLVYKNSY